MSRVVPRPIRRRCLALGIALMFPAAIQAADAAGPSPDPVATVQEVVRNLPDGVLPLYVLGDLNEDGRVDREDLRILTGLVGALEKDAPPPRGLSCVAAGDVNLNGDIESADVKRLAEWLGKSNEIATPALYWKPGLPCRLARLAVASKAQARPGGEFAVMLIGSGQDARNTRVAIHSGPATVAVAADGSGFTVATARTAKDGDYIVLRVTEPERREYFYTVPVVVPPADDGIPAPAGARR